MASHEYQESVFRPRSGAPLDPLRVVTRLAGAGLFDDYLVYEKNGTWTYAGGALATVSLDAHHTHTTTGDGRVERRPWTGSPGNALRAALDTVEVAGWNAYGWLDFEFAALLSPVVLPGAPTPEGQLARLVVPRVELRIDADGVVGRFIDETGDGDLGARIGAAVDATLNDVDGAGAPVNRTPTAVDVTADPYGYRDRVAQAVKEIRADQYRKVIISRVVDVPFSLDFLATYEVGRRANTPARSFLLHVDGFQATGFSPEVIVTVDPAGEVITQPLAGTRAFGRGSEADAAARDELLADPKEVFEHALSVLTAQDELRAVCRPDTVGVRDFMNVKERGSVQHLASLVGGTLRASSTAWDALEAVFPAVTASGIPKRESIDAIFRLDETRRGLYAGSVLSVSHDGSLDAALVLRAVYAKGGRTWLRAGAGIVTGSTPDREFEETCEKLTSVAPFLVRGED